MSAAAVVERRDRASTRLLARVDTPLPRRARSELLAEIDASGLTGRGGAGFPTARKLAAVAKARRPLVVANGTEGEPASWKDKVLLSENPHLVVDGAVVAARIVGAREIVFAVGRANRTVRTRLAHALNARSDGFEVGIQTVPERFVAGEESALLHHLEGGPAKPTIGRPYERGVLVQNVETLANLGLVARYGSDWFRERGTAEEPGTVLVTVLGAVRRPGVAEVELGTPIRDVLQRFGGLSALPHALLIGGYFGTWVRAHDVLDLPLANAALKPLGASLGARTIVVLPHDACGLRESARVARYLADESAGQCGPCVFGIPAMADALERLDVERLRRLAPQVTGRGACAHPTGATRFVASAVDVFADEIRRHRQGRCCGANHDPVLPLGASRDWR
ncbi:MAG TPA: NADH-ubiquinone oxidoreductase-F iron-sulfur binding region domain-containing protein [Gaiellaceae bacterium]